MSNTETDNDANLVRKSVIPPKKWLDSDQAKPFVLAWGGGAVEQ